MPLSGGSSSSGIALVKVDVPNIATNGNILTASTSVDLATHITFTQTTAGITAILLNPTITTVNKNIILQNLSTSTQTITINCVGGDLFSIAVGQSSEVTWNGTSWKLLNPAQVIPDYVEVATSGTFAAVGNSDHAQFNVLIRQIGTSITPDISTTYNTANNVNSLGRFLLQPGKTYELEGDVGDIGGAASSYINYNWVNADTGVVLTTGVGGANIIGANLSNTDSGRLTAKTTFTPSVATRVELRFNTTNAVTSYGGAFASNKARACIQVISGLTPTTGQSVDYAETRFITSTTSSVLLANSPVPFETLTSGNLTYTNPNITLKANRTYELESSILTQVFSDVGGTTGFTGGGDLEFIFYNVTAGAAIGTAKSTNVSTSAVSSFGGSQQVLKTFFTPTVDTQVQVRMSAINTAVSARVYNAGTYTGSSYFIAKQVGSTATISGSLQAVSDLATGGSLPAVSSSTIGFNVTQTTASQTLSLPTPTSVSSSYTTYVNNTGTVAFTISGISVSVGQSIGFVWNGSAWFPFGAVNNTTTLGEYGENNGITSQALTASYVDVTGSSFILPSAGVWAVDAVVSINSQSNFGRLQITDSVGTVVAGSIGTVGSSADGNQIVQVRSQAYITTTGATNYKLQVQGTSAAGTTQNSTSNGQSKITWRKISGFLPVSGQSVDYVIVKNKVTTANVANQAFFKPDTIVTGNIPYNATTGLFSLSAGKTYELVADLAFGGGQSGIEYVWKDNGSGVQIGSQGVSVLDNGAAGAYSVLARAIYTPSTNTTVGVVNLFTTAFPLLGAADTTSTGSTGLSQPSMTIKQLGSSATLANTSLDITNLATGGALNGGATIDPYVIGFNLAQTTASQSVSIPNPTTTTINRVIYINNTGTVSFTVQGFTISVGQTQAFIWNGTAWSNFTNNTNQNVLSEYGENNAITNTGTFTTTLVDIAGSSFTLPSAGVWEVIYNIFGSNNAASNGTIGVYDSSNTLVSNSICNIGIQSGNAAVSVEASNKVFITTTGSATYKLRGQTAAGTITIANLSTLGVNNSGNSKISWVKIGGFLPVTGGTTVDTVSVNLTGSNFSIPAVNTDVIFNTLAFGNIPYNTSTGVFTLTSGKTYELEATLKSRSTAGGYIQYEWVDATTNIAITGSINGVDMQATSTLSEGSSARAYLLYTPATNQTVKVRVTGISGVAMFLDASRCNANIKQLGSSATTTFQGATSTVAGQSGYVPQPIALDNSHLLCGDGTWGSSLIAVRTLTSGTSYTPTSGTNKIIAYVVGGGGAGGGCAVSANALSAGGGGAGGIVAFTEDVSDQVSYTYSIGTAGAGVSAANGGSGTASSIIVNGNTYAGNGGSGAVAAVIQASPTFNIGGNGGTTSPTSISGNTFIATRGGNGGIGISLATTVASGGIGGSNMLGVGGRIVATNTNGAANGIVAQGFGAGGSGSYETNSTATLGGDGTAGAIIIYEIR